MSLRSTAFCYSQTGSEQKEKELYQQALKDYPENAIAAAALNMINSPDDSEA